MSMSTEELAARIATLEKSVQLLRDREAIRDLRFRYHQAINSERLEQIPGLFVEDGVLDFGYLGTAIGRAEIGKFFDRTGSPLTYVRQFIHNHAIEISGDEAMGYAFLEAKTISSGEAHFVAARYDDEYVRHGNVWRFRKMSLEPYFTVPLSEGWAQENRLKMKR